MWTLSGFADEIADDFSEQLALLQQLGVGHLELRSAWGTNITQLDAAQLDEAERLLDQAGIRVSAIGSPIGKQKITDDFEPHVELFAHTIALAQRFRTPLIRVFSFFIPSGDEPAQWRDEVMRRMRVLVDMAAEADVVMLHENEKEIFGDTAERCLDLLQTLGGSHFRAILDPANFVQCEEDAFQAMRTLRPHLAYLHMKDARFGSGEVVPVGEGDGRVPEILSELNAEGFDSFLSLEPHLSEGMTFGGFSGPEEWTRAHTALMGLLDAAEMEHQ